MKYNLKTALKEPNLKYYDPTMDPFRIHGVLLPDGEMDAYHRLPKSLGESVSDGVKVLFGNTAGGRIRFVTDSPYVAIKAYLPNAVRMSHMAQTGIAGFSVYAKEDGKEFFVGVINPHEKTAFEEAVHFRTRKLREVIVYVPLYNNVNRVYVGLDSSSTLLQAPDYAISKPVLFYGSSITQGGCASKPGSDYEACLSRTMHFDYINLGFSGNAKGEPLMAEYIAKQNLSAFVLDYDYNAPNPEHLRKTHEVFFQIIRKAQPDLPILMISKPETFYSTDNRERFAIIEQTYNNAKKAGDQNVCLIDGTDFFRDVAFNDPTVDGTHPTDYGFFLMAKGIAPVLGEMLKGADIK